MTGAFYDELYIRPGETFTAVYALYDETGALIDTAGYAVRMQVRATVDDPTPLLDLSTANGTIAVGRLNAGSASESNLRIVVPPSSTAALPDFGRGVFDVVSTDNAGVVTPEIYGLAIYWPAVTR